MFIITVAARSCSLSPAVLSLFPLFFYPPPLSRPAGQHKLRARAKPVLSTLQSRSFSLGNGAAYPSSSARRSLFLVGRSKSAQACRRRRYMHFPNGHLILSPSFPCLPQLLQDKIPAEPYISLFQDARRFIPRSVALYCHSFSGRTES
jgi:hypothetical protein